MKTLLSILAAGTALIAGPAMAQTTTATGTITLTGTVSDKCSVIGGTGAGGSFTDSRNLLELAKADGMLEDSSVLETRFGAAGTTAPSFRVNCTTVTPKVSVTATALKLGGSPAASPGYTDTVNFTATARVNLANSTSSDVVNASTAGAATTVSMANRLAAAAGNVTVTTSNYTAGTNLLMAGAYTGSILVTVAPL